MRTIMKNMLVIMLLVLAVGCSSKQSLQEYFIDNYENPNFISFDVPTSVLNLEETDLSISEKEAAASLKKLNVLAFKKTKNNDAEYTAEKVRVKAILKNEKYIQLLKMNTSFGKATIKYLGEEDAIEEVVVFGDNKEKGFALIRILGDDMNPAHLVQLIQSIEKSNFNGEGFDKLKDILK